MGSLTPNRKQRKQASRQAARALLHGMVSGETELYLAYRKLYGIWCNHNSAVQELRPLFRIPGADPDGRLSVTKDFEAQVRLLATEILPSLKD